MAVDLAVLFTAYRSHPDDATLTALLESVRRLARRITGPCNNIDRDDLVQTIVIAVWQALPSYNSESEVSTWINGIARRKINDAYRQLYSKPKDERIELEDLDERYTAHPEPYRLGLDSLLPVNLTPEERTLVTVLCTTRLQSEVAAELGISHSALRSRKKRLRKKMLVRRDTFTTPIHD